MDRIHEFKVSFSCILTRNSTCVILDMSVSAACLQNKFMQVREADFRKGGESYGLSKYTHMKPASISKCISILFVAIGLLLLILASRNTEVSQASDQAETNVKTTESRMSQTEEDEDDLLDDTARISDETTEESVMNDAEETEPAQSHTEETEAAAEVNTELSSEAQTESPETVQSETPPSEAATEQETETEEPVYFRENREISQYSKVIMVGDSRFVGMSSAVSFSGCEWICDVGAGYDWLANTAASQIDSAITENCAIVFNMGVNDIDRAGEYVSFLNGRVEGWTSAGADVYFMTVNPVDRSLYSGVVTNEAIVNFNNTMSANLSPWFGYIDTYNDLTTNGFTSRDGLHYTNETYVQIFQYCMNQLHVSIS